jgi:hypothetical protein
MGGGEAAIIYLIVFHLTRSGLKHMIYRTGSEHTTITPTMWFQNIEFLAEKHLFMMSMLAIIQL